MPIYHVIEIQIAQKNPPGAAEKSEKRKRPARTSHFHFRTINLCKNKMFVN